jgi:prepilin-type N-terminal cleavage/methylation domain-containing protein
VARLQRLNPLMNNVTSKMNKIEGKLSFTLIELLVVIAIIVVLVSASLIGLSGSRETARDAKRRSDLEAIRSALELYKADTNAYPAGLACNSSMGSCDTVCPCAGSDWGGAISTALEPNYIANLPIDPLNDGTHFYYYNPVCSSTVTICGINKTCTTNCCAYELGAENLETGGLYTICSP